MTKQGMHDELGGVKEPVRTVKLIRKARNRQRRRLHRTVEKLENQPSGGSVIRGIAKLLRGK